jgi:hypothetical protein
MNRAAALPLMVCSAVASIALASSAGKTAMDAHQFADKANALFVDGKPVEVQRDATNAVLAGLFGVVAIGSLVWWVSGDEDAPVQLQAVPQTEGVQSTVSPVAATAVQQHPAAPSSAPSVPATLPEDMGRNPYSTIISAAPRTGKGVLVSQAIATLKHHHPEMEVWVIDPKADPKESHYWVHADQQWRHNIMDMAISPNQIAEELQQFIREFCQSTAPGKLLVIDETPALLNKLKRSKSRFDETLIDFAIATCSMGSSRKQFAWILTQTPNAGDLKLSASNRNAFARIFLVSLANLGNIRPAQAAMFVSGNPYPSQYQESGRVAYVSRLDKWVSIPKVTMPTPPPALVKPDIDVRAKLESLLAHPDSDFVSTPDTVSDFVSSSEPSEGEASEIRIDSDTVSRYFPNTTETDVFGLVQAGYEYGFSPSDVVKKQLKFTQPDRYVIGKAIAVYLVRKFGNAELFNHFKKWMEA